MPRARRLSHVRVRRRMVRRTLVLFACSSVVAVSAVTKLGWSSYTVASASMEPTLHCAGSPRCRSLTADRLLANRWIYLLRSVRRGDVVIIRTDSSWCGDGATMVKRVIGVPGDRLQIVGRIVRVNGRLISRRRSERQTTRHVRKVRVPSGHYFVVGDSGISCDSRARGTIPRRMIVAKAVAVWSPLRHARTL